MSRIVILMGVSGCGKSTVGELLASRTGGAYYDGDDFHPPENVEKMRSGTPLTDKDRVGWMNALQNLIRDRKAKNEWTFIACSALRRYFRDGLREADPELWFIFLKGSFDLIHGRISAREDHYMPASLLESQFAALEEPGADEADVTAVSIEGTPEEIADEAATRLGLEP